MPQTRILILRQRPFTIHNDLQIPKHLADPLCDLPNIPLESLLMHHGVALVIDCNCVSECDINTVAMVCVFIETLIDFEFEEEVARVAMLGRVGGDAVGVVEEQVRCEKLAQGEESVEGGGVLRVETKEGSRACQLGQGDARDIFL